MRKKVLGIILTVVILACAIVTVPMTAGATPLSYLEAQNQNWASNLNITTAKLEQLKNDMHNALINVDASVDLSSYNIAYNQANFQTVCDITMSFNDIFYLSPSFSCSYSGSYFKNLNYNYSYSKTECKEMYNKCVEVGNKLIGDLKTSSLTDVEKALLLHDRLAVWCEYDESCLEPGGDKYISHTMYGTLVNKISVCQGYTYAYEWLLGQLGIRSYTCSSEALNHIWNIVTIDGKDYNVDITFDDPTPDTVGYAEHRFFLKSYSAFQKDGVHGTGDYSEYQSYTSDTKYDSGYLWEKSNSAFQYLNGKIYYIDNSNQTLCQYNGLSSKTVLADVKDTWKASASSNWIGNFSKLSSDGKELYYNKSNAIYMFDTSNNTSSVVYTPQLTGYYSIFGFKAENGCFIYETNNNPSDKTNAKIFTVPRLIGDVNGDGEINVADRIQYSRYLANWNGYKIVESLSDIDKDGKYTQVDRIILARYIANWTGYSAYFA